jgi:hypothetical protein
MTTTGAPAERVSHSAVWTGSEMIIWGGYTVANSALQDTFVYTPVCRPFAITDVVRDGGNLILNFPTMTGRTYSLWRSDTLTSGAWTNTGLLALAGTGTTQSFTIPVPAGGVFQRFFRVDADPKP